MSLEKFSYVKNTRIASLLDLIKGIFKWCYEEDIALSFFKAKDKIALPFLRLII